MQQLGTAATGWQAVPVSCDCTLHFTALPANQPASAELLCAMLCQPSIRIAMLLNKYCSAHGVKTDDVLTALMSAARHATAAPHLLCLHALQLCTSHTRHSTRGHRPRAQHTNSQHHWARCIYVNTTLTLSKLCSLDISKTCWQWLSGRGGGAPGTRHQGG